MKVVVDENIPKRTVEALRASGHVVSDMRGSVEQGSPDADLWNIVLIERALLITTDKGFTVHRDEAHFGILIIRLRQPNLVRIHARIMAAIARYGPEDWPNMMLVMRDRVQSLYRSRPHR